MKIEHLVFPNSKVLVFNNYTRVSYSDDSYGWYRTWVELEYLSRAQQASEKEWDVLELGYCNAGLKK